MINNIVNSTRNLRRLFTGNQGNTALATLANLNQVIDSINQISSFREMHLLVSQLATENPTYKLLSLGVSDANCDKACGGNDVLCCRSNSGGNANVTLRFTRTDVGTYTLDINVPNSNEFPSGTSGTSFVIGAPSVLGYRLAIAYDTLVTSPNSLRYTFKTYNAAGVLTDGILANTFIIARTYPYQATVRF